MYLVSQWGFTSQWHEVWGTTHGNQVCQSEALDAGSKLHLAQDATVAANAGP